MYSSGYNLFIYIHMNDITDENMTTSVISK